MAVKRIVTDIQSTDVAAVRQFYEDVFDLEAVMDQGWIVTLSNGASAPTQVSIASHGGSGTDTPDMSIEVDNLEEVYARVKALGHKIVYDIADEPWGVRRFYVQDPAGKVLNVLTHTS